MMLPIHDSFYGIVDFLHRFKSLDIFEIVLDYITFLSVLSGFQTSSEATGS